MGSIERIPSWLRWIILFPVAILSWKLVEWVAIFVIGQTDVICWFIPKPYLISTISFIIGPVIFLGVAFGIAPTENKWFRLALCLSLATLSYPAISKILRGNPATLYNPITGVTLLYETILSIIYLIIIGAFIVDIFRNKPERPDAPKSKYFEVVDTNEGQVHVLTKTRWLYIFSMPHTSIMPHRGSALMPRGTLIKWTTNDPVLLGTLHDAIVRMVQEVSISGMVEIAQLAKVSERVWKTVGGPGSGLHEIVKQAAQDGVSFPVPEHILKYIKGFM